MRSTKFRAALAAIAATAMLLVALPMPAAQAAPTVVPINVSATYELPHQGNVAGLAANEFVYDSARGEDAPTTGGTDAYPIAYLGSLDMSKVWSNYTSLRFIWMIQNNNDIQRWNEKTFTGTFNISFTVDPSVVSVNPDFVTCPAMQSEIAKRASNKSFGDIMRCVSVSYDAATGVYSSQFRLQVLDDPAAKVTGKMLDDAKYKPSTLTLLTPASALYVKQSNFEAGKSFDMVKPHVDGEMTMDYFYYNMPLVFDNTGNTVTLKMVGSHDATFSFVSGTAGKTLPQEVLDLTPAKKTMIVPGQVVTPPTPTQTTVDLPSGTWTFQKWTPASATMENSNLEFEGTWTFEAKQSTTTFEFVSGTQGKDLPAGVTDQLPADVKNDIGSDYTPPTPATTAVDDAANKGVWTFDGWDPASATISADGNTFTGTWTFSENPPAEFPVTYEFVSGTAGQTLPSDVMDQKPADSSAVDGTTITPATPAMQQVMTAEGVWEFKGWDPAEATVAGAAVKFTGTWDFTPTPPKEQPIAYQFISDTEGQALPAGVMDQLPPSGSGKDGDVITPAAPATPSVTTETGTWTFVGWDPESATINGATVNFNGHWAFEATPVATYTIKHSFAPATAGQTLPQAVLGELPADVTIKEGETYTPPAPAQSTVKTDEGTWTFEGWNPESVTGGKTTTAAARAAVAAAASDITVVGTWSFKAAPTVTPTPTPTPTPSPSVTPIPSPTDTSTPPTTDTPAPTTPTSSTPGTQLPDTGFTGLWGALAALVLVGMGVAVIGLSRARRRH